MKKQTCTIKKRTMSNFLLALVCGMSLGGYILNGAEAHQDVNTHTDQDNIATINISQAPIYQNYDDNAIPNEQNIIEIEAVGIGVAPNESCTPAQAVALAKRAAIVDAYRQLGEQMYGIKLNSNDTVRNMVLKNSNIKTRVNAVIRGAQVRESACDQGICQVTMELKLDGRVWSKVLGI